MTNNLEVVGLIATLQESVEHEIGHLKYHCEGIDDPGFLQIVPIKIKHRKKEDTPATKPLCGEAGSVAGGLIRATANPPVSRQVCHLASLYIPPFTKLFEKMPKANLNVWGK